VHVPCRAGARLESDTGASSTGRIGCLEQRIDAYRAGKILRRSFPDGCEPLRLISMAFLLAFLWRRARVTGPASAHHLARAPGSRLGNRAYKVLDKTRTIKDESTKGVF
jgi:hypothetical protein